MTSAPVRALLNRLIDYAGLFPPARLPMSEAIPEYGELRRGPYAWMLGRFIVNASHVGELPADFSLSVIIDAQGRDWLGGVQEIVRHLATLENAQALEIPLPALRSQRDTYDASIGQFTAIFGVTQMRDRATYIEFPRDARWRESLPSAMAALRRHRLGAKIRCGGVTEDAFPSCEEVAAFILAATEAGVPFKATAGLHHPIRALDPAGTGFVMHGFLNVLVATLLARAGAEAVTLEAAIGEEDPRAFRFDERTFLWRDHAFDEASIAMMRSESFIAYGSCSIMEPVEDLTKLGVLE